MLALAEPVHHALSQVISEIYNADVTNYYSPIRILIYSAVKGEISAEDFEDMPCGIRILLIWKRQFKNYVNF